MTNKKPQDWHRADIVAALRKRNTSLAAESRRAGLAAGTLSNALNKPWPRGERIIAEALGVTPEKIWPSRYHDPVTGAFIDREKLMRNN